MKMTFRWQTHFDIKSFSFWNENDFPLANSFWYKVIFILKWKWLSREMYICVSTKPFVSKWPCWPQIPISFPWKFIFICKMEMTLCQNEFTKGKSFSFQNENDFIPKWLCQWEVIFISKWKWPYTKMNLPTESHFHFA